MNLGANLYRRGKLFIIGINFPSARLSAGLSVMKKGEKLHAPINAYLFHLSQIPLLRGKMRVVGWLTLAAAAALIVSVSSTDQSTGPSSM